MLYKARIKMEIISKIPIVMVLDKNYIFQTRVAIWSMRKSTPVETLLEIVLLCSAELDDDMRQILAELQMLLPNMAINFYEINLLLFSKAKARGYIPITAYYRLVLGEAIKEDKCLYLDGDIIVNIDLNDIYSVNIDDNYIAGVRNLGLLQNPEKAYKHMQRYSFDSLESYVNAGVLLLNLQKIREDNLQDKFLHEMQYQYPYMDQDVINKVCFGKIKLLELKYNVPACHVQFDKLNINDDLKENQIIEVKRNWKILHFMGDIKPWHYIRTWGATIWWKYAKEALTDDMYKSIYENAVKRTAESDWTYILGKCNSEKNIVIVGYSDIGIDVYESLLRCGVKSVFYFCDNSKEKQEMPNSRLKIFSVIEMANKYPEALWINTSQVSYGEINRQLKELGIMEERIVVYKYKPRVYYDMLDEHYVEYESRQLELKEGGK